MKYSLWYLSLQHPAIHVCQDQVAGDPPVIFGAVFCLWQQKEYSRVPVFLTRGI